MASVQELIAAAQAKTKRSPISQLADVAQAGFAGYDQGLADKKARIETSLQLIKLKQAQDEATAQEEMNRQISEQLGLQREKSVRTMQADAGAPASAVTPAGKFDQTITQDEKGHFSRTFKLTDPKPKDGSGDFYTAEQLKALGHDPVQVDKIAPLYVDPISKTVKIPKSAVADMTSLASKSTAEDDKINKQQDALEQAYRVQRSKVLSNRSGGLGLQDSKVNAAVHARQLIDGATDPKTGMININQITSPELALSLASLVSGGSAPALETIKTMTPEALSADIKTKLGFIFGKPVDVLPQEWAQTLKHMIDRQALTSEALRDNYMQQLKSLRPTRLEKSRADALESEDLGVSYADTFGLPKMKVGKEAQAEKAAGGNGALTPDEAAELKKLEAKYGKKK